MPKRGQRRATQPPVGDVRDPDSLWHHMQRYLAALGVRNYSPRSMETREAYVRYLIAWCDERSITKPQQLDRPILERYQRYLFYYRKRDEEPLSTRSQLMRISPIRHWLQWLVKQGHLLYSPAADLDL